MPYTRTTTAVQIRKPLHKRAHNLAIIAGSSIGEVVNNALFAYFESLPQALQQRLDALDAMLEEGHDHVPPA